MAVVKANAYGHGAEEVASAVASQVGSFGVATVEEALPLLRLGLPVFLLSPCLPCERATAVSEGLIPVVSSAAEALAYALLGPCRVNFKLDTGMGRIGCLPERAHRELESIASVPRLTVQSISTHLPSADEDRSFTASQLAEAKDLCGRLSPLVPGAKFHFLNSAGILEFGSEAGDIVRAGLAMYGAAYPYTHQPLLEPALTWKARVLLVRDLPEGATVGYGRTFRTPSRMRVASISVGYADGFPRQASGRGAEVLIGGVHRPVLGRVTMDQIVVDVSADPLPVEGDEVVLIGRQGGGEITAVELAEKSNTIAWHIFTGLGPRVHRTYSGAVAAEGATG